MDEKLFACLSRGYMILAEAYCEKHGIQMIDPRVVLADAPAEKGRPEDTAS